MIRCGCKLNTQLITWPIPSTLSGFESQKDIHSLIACRSSGAYPSPSQIIADNLVLGGSLDLQTHDCWFQSKNPLCLVVYYHCTDWISSFEAQSAQLSQVAINPKRMFIHHLTGLIFNLSKEVATLLIRQAKWGNLFSWQWLNYEVGCSGLHGTHSKHRLTWYFDIS